MSGTVFANGLEVSARQSDNQSIAAMPDVCLSPPSPPAGPIPIPYPNFSQASDTTDGTKTVKIAGDEVGMKNQSSYKSSKGDEAATKSLGMGINTASLGGKTFFAAWSSDVMFEGANAVRFTDLTTHNHANPATSGGTTASTGQTLPPVTPADCKSLNEKRASAESTDLQQPVQPGQTHALGRFESQSGTSIMGGVSHPADMLNSSTSVAYAAGKKWPIKMITNKKGGQTPVPDKGPIYMACGKNKVPYHRQGILHAESRMIEDAIAGKTPPIGRMTLSIKHWEAGAPKPDNNPCPSCQKLTCEAQACGLDIVICDGNTPTKPNCGGGAS